RIGNQLNYYFREDGAALTWSRPQLIASGVTGNPSFVQARPGTYGTMGNFELVVPLATAGIGHSFRDNDDPNLPWAQSDTFGTELGIVSAVSIARPKPSTSALFPYTTLFRSRIGNQLNYYFREDVAPFTWSCPQLIASGVTGNPSFVQARPGTY